MSTCNRFPSRLHLFSFLPTLSLHHSSPSLAAELTAPDALHALLSTLSPSLLALLHSLPSSCPPSPRTPSPTPSSTPISLQPDLLPLPLLLPHPVPPLPAPPLRRRLPPPSLGAYDATFSPSDDGCVVGIAWSPQWRCFDWSTAPSTPFAFIYANAAPSSSSSLSDEDAMRYLCAVASEPRFDLVACHIPVAALPPQLTLNSDGSTVA